MSIETLQGPYGQDIAKWQREGLGRMIGLRVPDIGRKRSTSQYRKLGYTLPLTDEKTSTGMQRYVLLLEAEQGRNRFVLVGPKQSQHENPLTRNAENNQYFKDFGRIFRPSRKPYLFETEKSKADIKPASLIMRLHCIADYSNGITNPLKFVLAALKTAKRLKEEREGMLRSEFNIEPTVIDAIMSIENNWQAFETQVWCGKKIQLFPDIGDSKSA